MLGTNSRVINPVVEGDEPPADRVEDYFDEARDRLRADMHFSRTSAAITPQVFTDVLRDGTGAPDGQLGTIDEPAIFRSDLPSSSHLRTVCDGSSGKFETGE